MNPNPTVRQAAVYARVATSSGQHEGSTRLDMQIAACQKHATNLGLSVPRSSGSRKRHLVIRSIVHDLTIFGASEAEFDAVAVQPGQQVAIDWSDRDVHRLSDAA